MICVYSHILFLSEVGDHVAVNVEICVYRLHLQLQWRPVLESISHLTVEVDRFAVVPWKEQSLKEGYTGLAILEQTDRDTND